MAPLLLARRRSPLAPPPLAQPHRARFIDSLGARFRPNCARFLPVASAKMAAPRDKLEQLFRLLRPSGALATWAQRGSGHGAGSPVSSGRACSCRPTAAPPRGQAQAACLTGGAERAGERARNNLLVGANSPTCKLAEAQLGRHSSARSLARRPARRAPELELSSGKSPSLPGQSRASALNWLQFSALLFARPRS